MNDSMKDQLQAIRHLIVTKSENACKKPKTNPKSKKDVSQ